MGRTGDHSKRRGARLADRRLLSVKAAFLITRPGNVALSALAVVVGAAVGAGVRWGVELGCAALSVALIVGAGNALNDVADMSVDLGEKSHRPIPRGLITPYRATVLAAVMFAAGLACALPLGRRPFLIAAVMSLSLSLYDTWWKRTFLFGNLLVACLSGLAFVMGAIVAGDPRAAYVPAGFAVLFHLGREMIKDAQDAVADRRAGFKTYAVVLGPRGAAYFAVVPLGAVIVLSPFPYTDWGYRWPYLVLVAPLVLILFHVVWSSMHAVSPRTYGRASAWLKAAMPFGMAALIAGRYL